MKPRPYTQENLDHDSEIIATTIKRVGGNYDLILALGRGGIPLGTRLSNLLNLPCTVVDYSLRDSTRGQRMTEFAEANRGKRILVVDDISDSGKTLEEVAGHLDGEFFHTATLIFKPMTSHYRPTYLSTIHMGDEWIEFFWEEPLLAK